MTRTPVAAASGRLHNARLVRQPDRVQTRILLLCLVAGVIILIPLMANVWAHAEAVRLGYDVEAALKSQRLLEERNRLLRAECASLRDLRRIEEAAILELGLTPRHPAATIVVTEVGEPSRSASLEAGASGPVAHAASEARARRQAP